MTIRLIVKKDGSIKTICQDAVDAVMDKIGPARIRRLSNINYNNIHRKWQIKIGKDTVAKLFNTKKEAVKWEIEYFNKELHKLRV